MTLSIMDKYSALFSEESFELYRYVFAAAFTSFLVYYLNIRQFASSKYENVQDTPQFTSSKSLCNKHTTIIGEISFVYNILLPQKLFN